MRAVRLPGIKPPTPVHVIYHYVHPMDECPNGGAEWSVTFEEVAPGLLNIQHPNCARCFAEPRIEDFEVVDGEVSDFRQAMVVSADGQTVAEERVELTPVEKAFKPWPEVKANLARARVSRQPSRETEILTDDGRFDDED